MAFNLKEFSQKYKMHPETESYLKAKSEQGGPPAHEVGVEEVRNEVLKDAEQFAGEPNFEGVERDYLVPSIYNKDGIPITAYRAKSCDMVIAPPVVVYFHGGGSCVGSRKSTAAVCKVLSSVPYHTASNHCLLLQKEQNVKGGEGPSGKEAVGINNGTRDAPCVVVNVEYRLAPEHKFPSDHDDAKCVVRWVSMNKSLVGAVNNSAVGVCGDSAGAKLAATVSHELSQALQFSILVYPPVNVDGNFKSLMEFEDGPVLSLTKREWFRDNYITEDDYYNPRASPLLYNKFTDVPPTLMIVAELDPFRDGCYAYYERLKQAGVKSQILSLKGVPHGFWKYPGHFVDNCRRAHEKAAKFIKAHS